MPPSQIFGIYEYDVNNNLNRVSQLEFLENYQSAYGRYFIPTDFGDVDNDGLNEILFIGVDNENGIDKNVVRLVESSTTQNFPNNLVWQKQIYLFNGNAEYWDVAKIADTDKDIKSEILVIDDINAEQIGVYENTIDNNYDKVASIDFSSVIPYLTKFNVCDDVDGDGKDEIIAGGERGDLHIAETSGDNNYQVTWTGKVSKGTNVSTINSIVCLGDTDSDGRKEFLAGGLLVPTGDSYVSLFKIYEANGNNNYAEVFSKEIPWPTGRVDAWDSGYTAKAEDFDNDGKKEIIFINRNSLYLYKAQANNLYKEFWNLNWTHPGYGTIVVNRYFAAGDFDNDRKGDIVFSQIYSTNVTTVIYEFGSAGTVGNESKSLCKVIAGYDFFNKDSDPMDDHGHGTHVAATAAGNGILKGVAPDAKIVAYKVLSNSGSGWWSEIIAAIDRSVDPNQDGNYNYHLDIISLSLGGSGNPDDPPSKAIDNAVNNGVVAVVAAGNSGPGSGTINSPGTARKAITVGAMEKNQLIASFSSRGPVTWSSGTINKPDVVAP